MWRIAFERLLCFPTDLIRWWRIPIIPDSYVPFFTLKKYREDCSVEHIAA